MRTTAWGGNGLNRCRHVLLAAAVLVTLHVRAEDPAGPGLDLLLLVDRSGSMSSHSPAAIVDALPLTLNVVAWSSRSARVNHRFGVVSFGSRAQVDVPLTIVDANGFSRLRKRIGALESRSLGKTNFAAPLEAAVDAFRALPPDSRRRRAILLLTDGHPDAPAGGARVSARHLQRLVGAASTSVPVTIDVLLFGALQETAVWQRLSRNRVHRVQSDRGDLLATLHRVVADAVGARSTQRDIAGAFDTLVLPPYLDLVVFDIFRGEATGAVSVLAPGASVPLSSDTPGVEEVHAGDVLSTMVVRRPAAGTWTFRKSDPAARVKVLSQQFFPRGVLVGPAASPPVRQYDHVTIQYRLDDGAGRPLQELLGYPLSVDVSLAQPDGRRAVLPMTRDAESPSAVYRTASGTECSVAGRYWTEVLVTTADSSGQPVRIFEDRWSGFGVETAGHRVIRSGLTLNADPPRPLPRGALHLLMIGGLAVPVTLLLFVVLRRR